MDRPSVLQLCCRSGDELPRVAVRMRMPLLFFYDGADVMYEGERTDLPKPEDNPLMPQLDDFASSPR